MFIKRDDLPDYNLVGIPFEVKAEDIDEQGGFKGWASTGHLDSGGDVVVKGAFRETILQGGRNRNGIPMLWQHNYMNPIGLWEKLEEKEQGLYVEGQIVMEVQKGLECYHLLKRGAIKGLSIGWDFPRDENGLRDPESYEIITKENRRIRYLKKLELWEISPVTFPMNIHAGVTTVKAFEMCKTERDYEQALREAGLSRSQAKHIVAKLDLREVDSDNEPNKDDLAQCILAEFERRRSTQPSDF